MLFPPPSAHETGTLLAAYMDTATAQLEPSPYPYPKPYPYPYLNPYLYPYP